MKIVFYDTETGGLDPLRHPLIQWAGVAVDGDRELEALEVKLRFDESKAERQALDLNHYNPAVWKEQAVERGEGLRRIGEFLKRNADVELLSKAGRPYLVAQGAGYNVSFDMGFTKALFGERFLPLSFRGLDVMSLALWRFMELSPAPQDYKLTTVAAHLGLQVDGGAHDALVDARLAWRVATALRAADRKAA